MADWDAEPPNMLNELLDDPEDLESDYGRGWAAGWAAHEGELGDLRAQLSGVELAVADAEAERDAERDRFVAQVEATEAQGWELVAAQMDAKAALARADLAEAELTRSAARAMRVRAQVAEEITVALSASMVEAAAENICESTSGDWRDHSEGDKDYYRRWARDVLTAALAGCEVTVDNGIAGRELAPIPRGALVRRLLIKTRAEEVPDAG